jgi:hypothetical protein
MVYTILYKLQNRQLFSRVLQVKWVVVLKFQRTPGSSSGCLLDPLQFYSSLGADIILQATIKVQEFIKPDSLKVTWPHYVYGVDSICGKNV